MIPFLVEVVPPELKPLIYSITCTPRVVSRTGYYLHIIYDRLLKEVTGGRTLSFTLRRRILVYNIRSRNIWLTEIFTGER